MLTSRGDEHVAVEAIKAGAWDYMVKSGDILSDLPRIATRALRECEHIARRIEVEKQLRFQAQMLDSVRESIVART